MRRAPGEDVGEPRTRRLWGLHAAGALSKRPDLWWVALVEARALVRRRWWASWPPVPRLARSWLEFRMETAYGDPRARPPPGDVVTWLEWARSGRRSQRKPA